TARTVIYTLSLHDALPISRRKHLMGDLWQDVRFGLRTMLKQPVFTGVAVLVLALGIGGNTAIFSLVNAILLRQLPFRHPEQLVWVSALRPDPCRYPFTLPHFI